MDKLPLEILTAILHDLPPSSCASARLTSRAFNAILAGRVFKVLASFLDPQVAQKTLTLTARDPVLRASSTRAIWSPHCLVPDSLPITESFLLALWTGARGESWWPGAEGSEQPPSVSALCEMLGVDENALRQMLFRYALYLSYVCPDGKLAPQAWVLDFLLHRNAEVATKKTPGVVQVPAAAAADPVKPASGGTSYWQGPSLVEARE